MEIDGLFKRPKNPRQVKKWIITALMVVFTAFFIIKYNEKVFYVENSGFLTAGLSYAIRYIPLVIITAVGGNIPGVICVLLVFMKPISNRFMNAKIKNVFLPSSYHSRQILSNINPKLMSIMEVLNMTRKEEKKKYIKEL